MASVTKNTKDTKDTKVNTDKMSRTGLPLCVHGVLCVENISEPEDQLSGDKPRLSHPAAVALVDLRRHFHQQIALDRIAAAGLHPRHRRVPGRRPFRSSQFAEAQMIGARRHVK